jgi:mRNA-degrading endonuclease RelE of RelBE toxin-antitoxin system
MLMPYTVLVSKTFLQKFQQLPTKLQNHLRNALQELRKNPYTLRPKCDIKELRDTCPKKHRLRVGEYRVIYAIDNKNVKIIDLIKREVGYGRVE